MEVLVMEELKEPKQFWEVVIKYQLLLKKVMKLSERRKYDIFNNLQSHRNYFDHLDRVQPCFNGKIGSYILLKCELLFRIYILKDLNISINTDKLKENIKSIERRYK